MKKSLLILALAFVVLSAGTAMADAYYTQVFSGVTFSGNLAGSCDGAGHCSADLTLGGPAGYTTNDVAAKITSGSLSNIVLSTPSGWTAGTGNVQQCTTGTGGWVCAQDGQTALNGLEFKWTFDSTSGTIDPFSIQFKIYNSAGQFLGNFSCPSTDNPCGTTQTPEPASLALLSAGLIGLGGLIRRRK
jgi:hypothetical protein